MSKNRNHQSQDDRLRASDGDDDDLRDTRAQQDAAEPGRETEDDAWLDELSQETLLPMLPPIPGFRTIWLSTSHESDTIQARMRVGYTMITKDDLKEAAPEWAPRTVVEGPFAGGIQCREMIAFKFPEDRWKKVMQRLHHEMPNAEEGRIRSNVEQEADKLRAKGSRVYLGDGTADLGKAPRKGVFS